MLDYSPIGVNGLLPPVFSYELIVL